MPTGLPLGTLPDSLAWAATPQPTCPSAPRGNGNSALWHGAVGAVSMVAFWFLVRLLAWLLTPCFRISTVWLWGRLSEPQQDRVARLVRVYDEADQAWAGVLDRFRETPDHQAPVV